ncbi:MAG: tetratricopeptide repeat protein [Acidobacteria bacterium]|nr:MAG: tetratricopeptide repeat protein [Acidobacteriota bacterium]
MLTYWRALDLYKLLTDVVPDDPEVLAYLGRCYARTGQWDESEQAFEQALIVARKVGVPVWWIYRDWGHILARFSFYSEAEAEDRLAKAVSLHGQTASIEGPLGYMCWRKGEHERAREHFETALELEEDHEYTLTYYSKFLVSIGEEQRAVKLRERLKVLQSDTWFNRAKDYVGDYDEEDV